MDLLKYLAVPNVVLFILVIARVSGMIVAAPLFGMSGVPNSIRVGFAVTLAFLMLPGLGQTAGLAIPKDLPSLAFVMGQEILVGVLLGFVANLLFQAVRVAGDLISMQTGLSMANMLDPVSHQQTPVLAQVYFYLAMLLFLSLNVHHWLLVALDKSFQLLPVGQLLNIHRWGLLTERVTAMTAEVFLLAVMVALPVVGTLLVVEIAMAFMAKAMPQMNVFIVGLPLKIVAGLWMILVSLPVAQEFLTRHYDLSVRQMLGLFQGMS
jgi:flagellar biosynthetic protein FliR